MSETIEKQVLEKIKKARRGSLFFTDSFINISNNDAIRKALERLARTGEIKRVATGIYVRPEIDKVIGELTPDIQSIAKAIAKRDKARIIPTGQSALNKLGLSQQVPMNVVYITDGASRKVKVGNQTILFKKATPKNLAAQGEISGMAIQALKTIGKENVTKEEIEKIQRALQNEKNIYLNHDIRLAPEWIRGIFSPVLNSKRS